MTPEDSISKLRSYSSFQRLFEQSLDAVALLSSKNEVLFANPSFVSLCGGSMSEIQARLGLKASKDPHPLDMQEFYQKALLGEEQESRHALIQNSVSYELIARYIPHFDESDKVFGMFLHLKKQRDTNYQTPLSEITALSQHFAYFSSDVLTVPKGPIGLGFWAMEVPSRALRFSEQLIEDWGLAPNSHAETMDEAIHRIYHEDQDMIRARLTATIERGEKYWAEYRLPLSDGTFLWIETRAEQIKDENGKLVRLIGTIHDITEQKLVEKELRESEKWFRILSDYMPQMIWTANTQGQNNYVNKKWIDFVGPSELSVDEQAAASIHPEDKERSDSLLIKALESGQPFETEFRLLRHSDQTYRWHLTRAVPLRDESGNIVRWLGSNTDIDDQKQLVDQLRSATAEAEKASLIKSSFLANMSHEIRTPLTAIIGFTQLLSDKSIDESLRESYLRIIHRNSKALSLLINDILDITKFESGNYSLEQIDFRIDQSLEEVISIFSEAVVAKGLEIRLNYASGMPLSVRSDPGRLRQILVNIIGNAVKFTAAGSITIDVYSRGNPSGRDLFIEVSDTGIGLNDEQASRLFEPFSQADQSMTRKYGGSGLGLDLSRRFARALGGDVQLTEYAEGRGCTFSIHIATEDSPLDLATSLTRTEGESLSINELPCTEQSQRILLAEDSPENQFLLSEVLKQCGYIVDVASNGAEAVEMASLNPYDLILMDMQMPVLDGYGATQKLRALGFSKPILALTALAMEDDRRRILESGCNEHHTKPINFPKLMESMNRLSRAAE